MKRTVVVCDICHREMEENKFPKFKFKLRVVHRDPDAWTWQCWDDMDVCAHCMEQFQDWVSLKKEEE